MLEDLDLTQCLSKPAYKKAHDALELELGSLQRRARELKIPVVIVFEGWGAAGKGTLINSLMMALDPRGASVISTKPPTEEELLRPWLWRFWKKTPEAGKITIFDRSWYGRVLMNRVDKEIKKKQWRAAFTDITTFERQLTDSGAVIIKFFLHISKKEQKRRFESLEEDDTTAWRVTRADWRHHRQYADYADAVEEMLERTGVPGVPWTVVEAHDRRFAIAKVFRTVVDVFKDATGAAAHPTSSPVTIAPRSRETRPSILDQADLSLTLTRNVYETRLKTCQQRLWELEHEVYVRRIPVVLAFEGWDAAGKGGAIRRLVQAMDPRGYEVVPFAAPTEAERRHHYLWRFWNVFPKAGHITIYDRSWYGRVLVERVEGFCTESDWQRAYGEIVEMEAHWTDSRAVVAKFWLHIDQATQLKRFREREKTPHKSWKITDEDWRNREKWPKYKAAVDEMIFRTNSDRARWTVVEANCKLHARIKVLSTVIDALDQACG